jgi:hypothetical protein
VGFVAATLLIPSVGMAEFVYTGVEVSYVDVDLDIGNLDVEGDGYRFSGSMQLNDQLFLHGHWEDQNFDFDVDGTELEVGAGFWHSFSNTLDFVATLSYVNQEVESGGFSIDDDGLGLGAGIRTQLTDAFQIEASLQYVNFDEGGSDTGVSILGRYYFTDRFAFMLRSELADDIDTLSFGFRAEF